MAGDKVESKQFRKLQKLGMFLDYYHPDVSKSAVAFKDRTDMLSILHTVIMSIGLIVYITLILRNIKRPDVDGIIIFAGIGLLLFVTIYSAATASAAWHDSVTYLTKKTNVKNYDKIRELINRNLAAHRLAPETDSWVNDITQIMTDVFQHDIRLYDICIKLRVFRTTFARAV